MKATRILLAATALVFSLGAYSQTDTTKKDTTVNKRDTTKRKPELTESNTTNLQNQQSVTTQQTTTNTSATTEAATTHPATNTSNTATNGAAGTNTTANTGVTAATSATSTTPKPNFGRYYIPVLGNYNAVATTTDNKSLKVTPDESNPGKVWVEGLTEKKFYALLKAVPGTYKIPAQKQDDKAVAEGTLIYDETSKQISLCSGCGFNEQAPTATAEVVAATDVTTSTVKNKKHHQQVEKVKKEPVISFTGTKADQGTVSLLQ